MPIIIDKVVALATGALVVGILYWAQAVLIPLAVATLLAFVLSPVVGALHRLGLGRVPAVILVVVLVMAVLGGAGWALTAQFGALAQDLPSRTEALKRRIAEWRPGRGTAIDRTRRAVDEVVDELEKVERPAKPAEAPVPVVISPKQPLLTRVPKLLREVGSAGLVMLLVIFMLIELQSLRDRFIRLVGAGRLTLTTKALDEAGQRISHYLLSLSLVNAGIGVAFGLGLLLIGVPYALLWGALVALARFVPYVGVWMGLLLPMAMSLTQHEGWAQPLMVIGLFVTLEILANVVVEPVLYSQRTGLSKLALLVAIAFWTWLWGPIGLILATPLTAGFLAFAKYVPTLEPLALLLGDEPALAPPAVFYQRLVARDVDEATDILDRRLEEASPEAVADEILLPALVHLRRDQAAERLDGEDQRFVVTALRDIVEQAAQADDGGGTGRPRVLGCPTRDEVDLAALELLRRVLADAHCAMEVLPAGLLSAEAVDRVAGLNPAVVVVGSVTPGGLAQTRYLLKRLRAACPELPVLVARWGASGVADPSLVGLGVERTAATLDEARNQILALVPSDVRVAA
jgi:predicted PurR-regulated permease PerM